MLYFSRASRSLADGRRSSEYRYKLLKGAIDQVVVASMSREKRSDAMLDPLKRGNATIHRVAASKVSILMTSGRDFDAIDCSYLLPSGCAECLKLRIVESV